MESHSEQNIFVFSFFFHCGSEHHKEVSAPVTGLPHAFVAFLYWLLFSVVQETANTWEVMAKVEQSPVIEDFEH